MTDEHQWKQENEQYKKRTWHKKVCARCKKEKPCRMYGQWQPGAPLTGFSPLCAGCGFDYPPKPDKYFLQQEVKTKEEISEDKAIDKPRKEGVLSSLEECLEQRSRQKTVSTIVII